MNRTRRRISCPAGKGKATMTFLAPGKITDKQIFIIICSAAILVAALILGNFFLSGFGLKQVPNWECLECGHKFFQSGEKMSVPPIDCPEGHKGQAVMLGYRICSNCRRARILYSRIRLTREYAEKTQQLRDKGYEPTNRETADWPREVQFRLLDTGDQWTDWVLWRSPEAAEIQAGMKCPKCGRDLYPRRERKGSGGS